MVELMSMVCEKLYCAALACLLSSYKSMAMFRCFDCIWRPQESDMLSHPEWCPCSLEDMGLPSKAWTKQDLQMWSLDRALQIPQLLPAQVHAEIWPVPKCYQSLLPPPQNLGRGTVQETLWHGQCLVQIPLNVKKHFGGFCPCRCCYDQWICIGLGLCLRDTSSSLSSSSLGCCRHRATIAKHVATW